MNSFKKFLMVVLSIGTLSAGVLTMNGCAVTRDQSTTGQYVDDSVITGEVKAQFVKSKAVDASSISVETLKGTVQLSGFAKSSDEKASAEKLARGVNGVKSVRNDIIVKP